MTFAYIGEDGMPQPPVVLDPVAQVRQIFAALEAQAHQSLCPTRFVDFDDELPEMEELEHCARCTHPMKSLYIDEAGICPDCRDRELTDALHTPPFMRTEADWRFLVEHGFVSADEITLNLD